MPMNFNEADPQKTGFGELIPDGSVVILVASLRPGGEGPDGWLKNTRNGDALMADFEFTIDGGDFDRRKVWGNYITEGQTDGQNKAANITRSLLRAMLESAHGVDPADDSPKAMKARQVAGWEAFDGLRFCGKLGIEKGSPKDKMAGPNSEKYPDKNVLREAVTPDNPKYLAIGSTPGSQTARAPSSATAQKAPASAGKPKPSWAS